MTTIRCPRRAWTRHISCPLCRGSSGVAIDLGSARTRAWIAGRGMVLDVPTVTFPGTGAVRPVRRGAVVDTSGTARMLDRLLGHRLPRSGRPLVVLTAPVLDGLAFRTAARTAVEVLLVEGAVTDARCAALGTGDLSDGTAPGRLTDAVAAMVTAMLRQDRTARTRSALRRGVLLSGGGALRPDVTRALPGRLGCPVRPVPSPHTAAVRGAAGLLAAARRHPSVTGTL
ncbi:hypothetical protein ACIF8T_37800 [Streptomyces sp. NPDC085946]|uniref:hypothetical protein n=1 Tax=Streptomyces sp. NPDC085946 TaxID=3365744 RepID=UPI0037D4F8C4